jgi:hypothetical protein
MLTKANSARNLSFLIIGGGRWPLAAAPVAPLADAGGGPAPAHAAATSFLVERS